MLASEEIVSTISSAGCLAASIAARTSSMRLVQPVEVSLCTTQTARMRCAGVAGQRLADRRHVGAAPPVGVDELRHQLQPLRHLLPEAREPAGAAHQHGSPGESVFASAASHAPVPDAG